MATLNQRQKRQTYWNSGRMSPALQRARQPFRGKNLITGGGIITFTISVYMYSIAAVKQDDFSDIPAPSIEKIEKINQIKRKIKEEEEEKIKKIKSNEIEKLKFENKLLTTQPIGLFSSTKNWIPGTKFHSKFVLDAPPIDQIGKINDRKVVENDQKLV